MHETKKQITVVVFWQISSSWGEIIVLWKGDYLPVSIFDVFEAGYFIVWSIISVSKQKRLGDFR